MTPAASTWRPPCESCGEPFAPAPLLACPRCRRRVTGTDRCPRHRRKYTAFLHRRCGRCRARSAERLAAPWEVLGIDDWQRASAAVADRALALRLRAEPERRTELAAAHLAVLTQLWRRRLLRVVTGGRS